MLLLHYIAPMYRVMIGGNAPTLTEAPPPLPNIVNAKTNGNTTCLDYGLGMGYGLGMRLG